jgi:protein-L-isoaspartate(D-aspartate) O-methyltransferase
MDRAEQFANARNLMVDGQVRPNRVYDPRVLDTMRRLPRERFVPPALAARAYADEDVPLGGGRYLTEPMVAARMAQLAAPRRGEAALVVAAGTGYLAALLAEGHGARVTAVEDDAALLAIARGALAELAPTVTLVAGRPAQGWREGAPYDVILIDGAVEEIPPALAEQLRPAGPRGGGRLVAVRRTEVVGQIVTGEVVAGILRLTAAFDAATPVLPAFRRQSGFVF